MPCFRPLVGSWLGKGAVTQLDQTAEDFEFPSPCEELVRKEVRHRTEAPTSVRICFRPLAGSWLGKTVNFIRHEYMEFMFPSPCGELVRKAFPSASRSQYFLAAFPSPCGELVRKVEQLVHLAAILLQFPSPCGELVRKA